MRVEKEEILKLAKLARLEFTDEEIARLKAPEAYYGPEDLERAAQAIQQAQLHVHDILRVWVVVDHAEQEIAPQRQRARLRVGDIAQLFDGGAHTGGDLSVWLPAKKILFLSETYLNRVFPAMRSASPDWLPSLDKAIAMKADLYIAGHGFTEDGPVSREEVGEYRKALAYVIAEATRLKKAGVPVEDAVKQANWGPYTGWFLRDQQAPVAVRKVYDEIEGRLTPRP